MKNCYSQNEEALQFILAFERNVEQGIVLDIQELVRLFEDSPYNKEQFDTYVKPKTGSIWYALKRSGKWTAVKKGTYRKN